MIKHTYFDENDSDDDDLRTESSLRRGISHNKYNSNDSKSSQYELKTEYRDDIDYGRNTPKSVSPVNSKPSYVDDYPHCRMPLDVIPSLQSILQGEEGINYHLVESILNSNNSQLIKILDANPALANSTFGSMGWSPLQIACQVQHNDDNNRSIISTLLQYRARIEFQDYKLSICFHYCHHSSIIQLICDHMKTAQNRSKGYVSSILNKKNFQGYTALQKAIEYKRVDCVKVLIENGADIHAVEPRRHGTCIHLAAETGVYDIFHQLVPSSWNWDEPDRHGNTVLHVVCGCTNTSDGLLKIFVTVLGKGATVDVRNSELITPLHVLCANQSLKEAMLDQPMTELLISKGANVNAQTNDGCTPLIITCAHRNWNLVKDLLRLGNGDLNLSCRLMSPFVRPDWYLNKTFDDEEEKKKNQDDMGMNGRDRKQSVANRDKQKMDRGVDRGDLPMELENEVDALMNGFITASDLTRRNERFDLFCSIRVPQTRVVGEKDRSHCMNCSYNFKSFNDSSPEHQNVIHSQSGINLSTRLRMTSGRHRCRHCNRIVCDMCGSNMLPRSELPGFIQSVVKERMVRLCCVCYSIFTLSEEDVKRATVQANGSKAVVR